MGSGRVEREYASTRSLTVALLHGEDVFDGDGYDSSDRGLDDLAFSSVQGNRRMSELLVLGVL
jgi:hypothetical protein